jgi:hypothetical protein
MQRIAHRDTSRFISALLALGGLLLLGTPCHAGISIGSLTLTGVYPRILTPNGDGHNDKTGFHFDNPDDLPVTGTVFDLSGARVADLTAGTDPSTLLVWDGKDSTGQKVAGGIYIYEIDYQGKHATGTVVVAR